MRGIAIVAVIWIHADSGIAYKSGPVAWNYDYWIVARQFFNFPVALFLFLSGFFVMPEKIARALPWMRRRAVRLLVPFFVWSAFYSLLMLIVRGVDSHPVVFAVDFLFGFAAAHLYFIVVLVQLTLLTPLMVRMIRTAWRWAGLAVTPAYIALLYGYVFATDNLPTAYAYPFAAWFVFYYLGLWAQIRGLPRVTPSAAATFWALAAALSVAEAYALLALGMPDGLAVSQLKFSSIITSLGFVAVVLAVKARLADAPVWLVTIGRDSYGIYYCHMVWLMVVSWIARKFGVNEVFPVLPLMQVVELPMALFTSVATIQVGRTMLGSQRASNLLGF